MLVNFLENNVKRNKKIEQIEKEYKEQNGINVVLLHNDKYEVIKDRLASKFHKIFIFARNGKFLRQIINS